MNRLILSTLMLVLPLLASAYDAEVDGIYYSLFPEKNEAKVMVSPSGYSGSVNIPEKFTYEGVEYSVTCIGALAFNSFGEYSNLTSVTIPNSVNRIEPEAFGGCSNLTSVNIPNSVTEIAYGAFDRCNGLTSVHITDLEAWCRISFGSHDANPLYCAHHLYLNGEEVKDLVIPNSVTSLGMCAFESCSGLTSLTIPNSVTSIEKYAFAECSGLTSVSIPNSLTSIGTGIFEGCSSLTSVTIPNSVTSIGAYAFANCSNLEEVYCIAENVPVLFSPFQNCHLENITLYVPAASLDAYRNAEQWKDFGNIVALPDQDAYRPFIEDDKVWKVGDYSGNPVQRVEYYYFDGDTIIDGKTCKQMMRQSYVNAEHPDYAIISQMPSLSYVGAWYEEDKKVYEYNSTTKQFKLMYDFSVDANASLQILGQSYLIGPRQTGGIKGFKGVYREVWEYENGEETFRCAPWLEGVGSVYGSPTTNVFNVELADPAWFLMSCTVGDEVIYLNDEYEDGATPGDLNGKKQRFDFTHTVKTKPKAPKRREERLRVGERSSGTNGRWPKGKAMSEERREEASAMQSLYGEYNEQKLDINLDPLNDAYLVRITDETDKTVYEKAINAGAIVALNIDISSYAEGRYTVTVENSGESFTGIFNTNTTGIKENVTIERLKDDRIYNLQGQRMSSLRRGVNIVNGRKVYVK